jgi:hypothetical protein
MKIDVVLTEAEIVQELSEAVEARDLPEKFFYWSPLSVRAWLARAADPAFAGWRLCWKALAERSAWLLEPFDGVVPVISFGAGDGATDRVLLESVRESGREQKYFPVDASQALLEMACAGAEDLDIETLGIKADISSPMHLVFASDAAESPKLMLMGGNTLGGFDPLDLMRHLGQCLHTGDRLVVDAEIEPPGSPPPPQDNGLCRFALAPLASLGVSDEEGEMRCDHKRDDGMEGLHMTAVRFRPSRDLRLSVSEHEVLVQRGENINLNFRYTFTREAFRELLGKHAGLRILEEIPSPDGRYLLAVCSR